jgi:tetratricopeptide (TPR) repeat protein
MNPTPPLVLLLLVSTAAVAATPPEQEQARSLVRSAKEAFDAGDFAAAAELLTRANALAPTAATLYNLGRARERAGDLAGAEAAYREYLTASPSSADRGAVEATITELQRRIAEAKRLETLEHERREQAARAAAAVVAPAPEPAAPPPRSRGPRVVPWVIGALGIAGLGTAVAFGVTASSRHASAVQLTDVDAALAAQRDAETLARVSTSLYVVAGAVLGAALLWLIIAAARSDDAG